MPRGNAPYVSVLMTSYNHAAFVGEQIDSIMTQTHGNWRLTVSDDGSTDGSLEVIKRYQAERPDRIQLVLGPGRGFPQNHLWLAAKADPEADYFAWADSDDVWLPDHLERAVGILAPLGQAKPTLYGGRVAVIEETGRKGGLYPLLNRIPPSFGNALVQNIITGPTSVFNRAAREIIAVDIDRGKVPSSQDWWAYLMTIGAGGNVVYDTQPTVLYRQHGGNILGSTMGPSAKFRRFKALIDGGFRRKVKLNLDALAEKAATLTPDSRARVAAMAELHRGGGGPLRRLMLAREAGVCRQSWSETAFLYGLAMLGLI